MKYKFHIFLIVLAILIAATSCKKKKENLTKDNLGYYISQEGNFKIKFPASPVPKVIDNQLGLSKFKIFFYKATKSRNEIFSIEFIHFPESTIGLINSENYYPSVIDNLTNLYRKEGFTLDSKKDILYKNIKGVEFRFDGSKGSIIGRHFKVDKTTYTILFMGIPTTSEIEAYFNSFELLK